jgi:hypothetical protein
LNDPLLTKGGTQFKIDVLSITIRGTLPALRLVKASAGGTHVQALSRPCLCTLPIPSSSPHEPRIIE